ncbi:MAG: S24/S26 family peptidase [Alistipes sp.]|nr:S24/S26 family peptidase [Alistipes sp.]
MSDVRAIANRELFSIVRDTLLEGKSVRVAVRGESMLPFFRSGSTITLRPLREGDIRKYNVVLADAGHGFVVHRIIEVGAEYVTLLGDGNIYGTERVATDKIYGVVDCSPFHIFFAKIWLVLRPFRRFPLAIFRRLM